MKFSVSKSKLLGICKTSGTRSFWTCHNKYGVMLGINFVPGKYGLALYITREITK